MNLNTLKKFAQGARRKLMAEVGSRLDYLISHDDLYIRAHERELSDIRRQLEKKSREQVIEEVAYTWFNRIVALRYMDLRGYHKVRIVSPQTGQVQPELLFQIKQGRTPKEVQSLQGVFDGYLDGTVHSDQPDREIYTAALLGICNDYSRTLPFLFRQVDAYMAVLLPTDLLSESSILSAVQGAIGEEDVADVEVIGWLYQFYISEKKDQVFGRPKGEKIKKEDIPAATQLFTPHWIVRYMVENSLGRLWRNNRPDTGLKEQMEFYIEGDPEPEYLTIAGPEEITLLDPACGSGHILTYAFDLLYGMYEEAGYSAEEIPSLILTNNLYGIDIDTRAAELASFALTMKAREKDRFFFKRGVVPRVVAMEDVSVDLREAGITMSPQLQEAFGYLTEATNFGSLIPVPAEVQGEIADILVELDAKGDADLFADQAMAQVRSGLRQLGYLARRYHCVVTNPPYCGLKAMNKCVRDFLVDAYELTSADLFAAFTERTHKMVLRRGYQAMITMDSWLSGDEYTSFRTKMVLSWNLQSLLHLGPHAFDQIKGEVVQVAAFVFTCDLIDNTPAVFFDLTEPPDSFRKEDSFAKRENCFKFDLRSAEQLPRKAIAYFVSPEVVSLFSTGIQLQQISEAFTGLQTGDNPRFIRYWWEVSANDIRTDSNSNSRWVPYVKGSDYCKWFGNEWFVLDWQNDGQAMKELASARVQNSAYYFRKGIAYNTISARMSARAIDSGHIFDQKNSMFFADNWEDNLFTIGLLNSNAIRPLLRVLAPKDFGPGAMKMLPVPTDYSELVSIRELTSSAIEIARKDWNQRETSRHFARSPLSGLRPHSPNTGKIEQESDQSSFVRNRKNLRDSIDAYTTEWTATFSDLLSIETQIENEFAKLYGLDTTNTVLRKHADMTILELELASDARQQGVLEFDREELARQYVSYGVGCIFGRYSLDKDGLILANAGDHLDSYFSQIPEPTLRPDESGILPITNDNDFSDDLPSQWRAFLRAAFGDERYEENLRFLEDALGKRLRPYFLRGFYDDHVKRYKKRPIYWLITSPKGTLQALIYLHRYNRDTVNRFLNDYLRPYQQKLEAKRVSAEHVLTGGGSSQSEKTKAQKRIDEIRKALEELSTWERDVVRPLAEKRIELDLDDGVKVNYGKLGAILAKVKGLNG